MTAATSTPPLAGCTQAQADARLAELQLAIAVDQRVMAKLDAAQEEAHRDLILSEFALAQFVEALRSHCPHVVLPAALAET